MSELIVVEAVSDKFKNKFSNGSVLSGGKWLQVSSKVPLNLFQKDTQVNVELQTNAKGYTSIIGIAADAPVDETPKPTAKRTTKVKEAPQAASYEDNKNKRIQVQGIIQSVVQSPATINFGDDVSLVASKVLELTDLLIAGMEERI
jgi:hypothetical protein